MQQTFRALSIVIGSALVFAGLASPAAAASSDVSMSRVLSGYTRPLLVTHAPGGGRNIFIVEQTGKIKRATYRNGAWRRLGTFLDISGEVNDPRLQGNGERGLLGLAFHPKYRSNGRFYVFYTRAAGGSRNGDAVVAEYRRKSAGKARPASRRVLLVVNQPASNHNGGHLAFGPDGYLYVGLGDGGGGGDPRGNAQDLRNRNGSLLRIDPLDPDGKGAKRYRTPGSNPRVGKKGLNDLWAWGLRNPWRFSFDRKNGDLWIGDVGQAAREEVNRAESNKAGRNAGRGQNYGWNRCEGTRRYPGTADPCTFGILPTYDYGRGAGRCSVTGGYVYRGPEAPAWDGLYVAGDFCGRLFVLDKTGRVRLSKVTSRRLSSFGEDAAGRLYATDLLSGKIFRVKLSGPRP